MGKLHGKVLSSLKFLNHFPAKNNDRVLNYKNENFPYKS